jgi:uncharacterized protein YndB with AHSA1/START domain
MKNTGTLKVETRGDREIVMTRVFDAPRELVFRALTTPELLKRWFGPHGWTLAECEIDLRVGGAWRFFSKGPNGRTMGMRGVYRVIAPPERLEYTESFDEWPQQGSALITITLAERNGRTTLTGVSLAPSREVRDAVIATGMEHGAAETYDRLADMLHALEESAAP